MASTFNTHFRAFARPMGLAVDQGRLAVGTEILEMCFRSPWQNSMLGWV
jgi:hypothetical protein